MPLKHTLALSALLLSHVACVAQTPGVLPLDQPHQVAVLSLAETPRFTAADAALPDAPAPAVSSSLEGSNAFAVPAADYGAQSTHAGAPDQRIAPRYATTILPGQTAVEMHGYQKAVYGFHESISPYQFLGEALSAGWSHVIDSAPHYGTDSGAFGERMGAAVIRGTVQNLATDAVFSPMFHDDPRYYAMGSGQPFFKRATYAATRVLSVRSSHSMNQRFNAPLVLGYLVTAAANNGYYPDRDRGASETFTSFGTSLVGAALGFEVNEFLDDALKMVHLRKQ
jgi:hypothetical protein